MSKGAIPTMTGVRLAAALWVFFFHTQQNVGTLFGLPVLSQHECMASSAGLQTRVDHVFL